MSKSILDILIEEEEQYIFKHYSSIKAEKQIKINQIIKRIKLQVNVKDKGYHKIILDDLHELSITKGGFISNENRLVIYEYIFNTFHPHNYQLLTEDWSIIDKNAEVILNDCKRSVIYSIITTNQFNIESTHSSISNLIESLNKFVASSLNPLQHITYYQGYQELALYFYLLFGKDKGIPMIQKFTQHYIHLYMSKNQNEKMLFNDVLSILSDCVGYINQDIYDLIQKITNTTPYYSLPWIITWFTHNNHNPFHQFRIMDYLICSNYDTVFALASSLVVDECDKLNLKDKIKTIDPDWYMGELFNHFQQLKIESLDMDTLINKAERTFIIKPEWVKKIFKKNLGNKANKTIIQWLEKDSFKRDNDHNKKMLALIIIITTIIIAFGIECLI